MTKTKYVLNGLMIFFGILFLVGFLLPFYRADISGSLGNTLVNGSLSASGIAFLFGLPSINSGYFLDKFDSSNPLYVRPQILFLIIAILGVILLILSIISISLKEKSSVSYHLINLTSGIVGITSMFLLIFSLKISNISLANSPEFEGYESFVQAEGLSYGAIISIFGFALYGLLALVLTSLSFFGYQIARKLAKKKGYAGPLIEEEKKDALPYHASKLLENKFMGKLLGFFKKDDEEGFTSEDESNNLNENNDIKEEINTSNNKNREKSLSEKLADLEKLHNAHQISDADYKKFRKGIIDKHYSDKNK